MLIRASIDNTLESAEVAAVEFFIEGNNSIPIVLFFSVTEIFDAGVHILRIVACELICSYTMCVCFVHFNCITINMLQLIIMIHQSQASLNISQNTHHTHP